VACSEGGSAVTRCEAMDPCKSAACPPLRYVLCVLYFLWVPVRVNAAEELLGSVRVPPDNNAWHTQALQSSRMGASLFDVSNIEAMRDPYVPGLGHCYKRHTHGEEQSMHRQYRNLTVEIADPAQVNMVVDVDKYLSQHTCEVIFFMVWSTVAASFSPRDLRSVESIFIFHQRACVLVASSTIDDSVFKPLTQLGFQVTVIPLDIHHLLENTRAQTWLTHLERWKQQPHFHSNISNAVRKAMLYRWGGIYMDFDVIVLRPIDVTNALSWMNSEVWLNGGVMVFEKGHPFLDQCLEDFAKNYNGREWGHNGPSLLTRVYRKYSDSDLMKSHPMTILPSTGFYPITPARIKFLFTRTKDTFVAFKLQAIFESSYTLHYYNNIMATVPAKPESVMDYLFHCVCILCTAIL
jgi:hypothetical protein